MFLIAPVWATLSIVAMAALYRYVSVREIEARWGDVRSGAAFERARRSLLALEEEHYHPKNWRPDRPGPQRRRLAEDPPGRLRTLAHRRARRAHARPGDPGRRRGTPRAAAPPRRIWCAASSGRRSLQAFPAVVVAPYLSDGIESLVQCHGLGVLRPNTVLLGWPNDPAQVESFGSILRVVAGLKRSIVAFRTTEEVGRPVGSPPGNDRRLVARQGQRPADAPAGPPVDDQPRVADAADPPVAHRPCRSGSGGDARASGDLIETSRIRATPRVIVSDDVPATIQQTSRTAAVAILGFEAPEEGAEIAFFEAMERLAGNLPQGDLRRQRRGDGPGNVGL